MQKKMSPYLIILLSFLSVIVVGSIVLILPVSLKDNIKLSYIDALFISTSSVTITGLTPQVLNETFSTFGKVVLTILIQVGGLSVTTIAFFIISIIGAKIGFGSRMLAKETISMDSMQGVVKVIKKIVLLAVVIESIAIIIFTIYFLVSGLSFSQSLGYSIFHTVASYNNAGFDIFGSNSLMTFRDDIFFNIITMLLILLGGLGSVVIFDIIKNRSYKKLSFHSKIVLKMSLILLLSGTVLFFLLEKDATILQSFFHSVTLRTAGFYSYDYGLVRQTTILIMIILMFIGAAPASNAGGIKVTTLYTLFKSTDSYIRNKDMVAYGRSIPARYERKAFMILFISTIIIVLSTVSVSFFEKGINLTTIFFEIISAFSNTGLTLNLTNKLSSYSKLIVLIVMIVGRVGVLTFVHSILKREKKTFITEYVDLEYVI